MDKHSKEPVAWITERGLQILERAAERERRIINWAVVGFLLIMAAMVAAVFVFQ